MSEVIFEHRRFKLSGKFKFDALPIFRISLPNGFVIDYVIDRQGNLKSHVAQLVGFVSDNWKIVRYNKPCSVEFLEKFNKEVNR